MTTMTRDQVLETVREAQAAGRRADLRGANLTGVDLTGATLAGVDLTYAALTRANLAGADLTDSHLTRSWLRDADLTRTTLTHAWLCDVDLTGATLRGVDLTNAWLEDAELTTQQLLDTRGLRPWRHGLTQGTWDELLPANPEHRRLVEHLLNDGWDGTLREAIETVEGLAGR